MYCHERANYVMSLMSTYGTNLKTGKETSHEWVDSSGVKNNRKFHNPEVVGEPYLIPTLCQQSQQ